MCELLQPIDLMRINTKSIRLGKTTNAMKQYREKKTCLGCYAVDHTAEAVLNACRLS